MINVIKDIKQNCQDQSIEGIVNFLVNRGDFSYTSNFHREVWFFYSELRKDYDHKTARKVTIESFKLSPSNFKQIIRKFKGH